MASTYQGVSTHTLLLLSDSVRPVRGSVGLDQLGGDSNHHSKPAYTSETYDIVQTIRPRSRGPAQNLLNALKQFPDRVKWTTSGVLYIDGHASGNIKDLLKKTFYTTLKFPIPGQSKWFALLRELSLGHHITNPSKYGDHKAQKRSTPFYFLGQ